MSSEEDVLVAYRYFLDLGRGQRWDQEGTTSDIVIMAVLPGHQWHRSWTTRNLTSTMMTYEPSGFLRCRLKNSKLDVSQSAQSPQAVIDFGEISRLIQGCQQNNRNCQNRTTAWQPIAISLIDCYSRKLIQTTSSELYVALSYVWGGVSAGTLDSGKLPRTLEDAIQVTQSLGFKYIWIDQFCVNQHDSALKHEQIRTMGMVYADAAVTLVAASGWDANHGLPGAPNHPFPGKGRRSIVMNGCIISKEAAPIDLGLQNSVWASRGWTFQEQFFSRRFLVFSLGQVSYECRRVKYSPRHGTADSSTEGPLENGCPEWAILYSRLHDRKTGELSHRGIRGSYHHLVAQYWPRHLSLVTDGINAFTAILEHLKTHWDAELLQETKKDDIGEYKITFTAGMPHLLRHNAESPDPDLQVFVDGLLWHCKCPMKRREGFPSWCWAGWVPLGIHKKNKTDVKWLINSHEGLPLIRNVFFTSSPATESSGGPRHHERVPIADHDSSSIPEAIILDAPVLRPSDVSWDNGHDEPSTWGNGTRWILADARVLKRDVFLSNFANGVYCLVVLAAKDDKFSTISSMRVTLLLVRRVDQYRYERIGLARTGLRSVTWAQTNKDLEIRTWELI